jgi:organic radical activating enzyme
VITGGEPMLQQRSLIDLAAQLHIHRRRVEVETNGTIAPEPRLLEVVSQFNVSPKLAGSGVPVDRRIDLATLRLFAASGKAVFKFVIADLAEQDELATLAAHLRPAPIWVMPQATDPTGVIDGLRTLADTAIAHGWNLSTRLHVLLWGDQRGR